MVDEQGKPVGLIDITDVVGQARVLAPEASTESEDSVAVAHATVRFPNH